jgi:UDP-glucose 4-epimerase/UDP-glucuronate decarboxylase
MPFQILRFHNIYGPGQHDHFIPEFVNKIKSGDFTLQGGNETRAFCYVSDALRATLELMSAPGAINQIINVGNDAETSIQTVAEIIVKCLNMDKNISISNGIPGSVPRRCPDITLLKKLISWQPKVTLEDGIRLTLESL